MKFLLDYLDPLEVELVPPDDPGDGWVQVTLDVGEFPEEKMFYMSDLVQNEFILQVRFKLFIFGASVFLLIIINAIGLQFETLHVLVI